MEKKFDFYKEVLKHSKEAAVLAGLVENATVMIDTINELHSSGLISEETRERYNNIFKGMIDAPLKLKEMDDAIKYEKEIEVKWIKN